jgi:hypothetical protein
MVKNTVTINIEDLRRDLGLPPNYTIRAINIVDKNVEVEAESPILNSAVKRIPGDELTNVLRAIEKSLTHGKEIIFSYYNEKRDGIEITSRRFLPLVWVNNDCIEGIDLDKKETRRFCPSRMNWIEAVVI